MPSGAQGKMAQAAGTKMRSNPGMRTQLKTKGSKDMPDDIGLMHLTYIRPSSDRLPSFFKEPRRRLKLDYLWVRTKLRDFSSLVVWCKWLSKPRQRLRLREREQAALDLHRELFTALAGMDSPTLKRVCCAGLNETSQAQIARRANTDEPGKTWKRIALRGLPVPTWIPWPFSRLVPFAAVRVVSDRAAPIPGLKGAGIRQTVVRIVSEQELETKDKIITKRSAEWIVLQKMTMDGQERGWKIWGTVEPTDTAEAEKQAEISNQGPGLSERLSAVTGR